MRTVLVATGAGQLVKHSAAPVERLPMAAQAAKALADISFDPRFPVP